MRFMRHLLLSSALLLALAAPAQASERTFISPVEASRVDSATAAELSGKIKASGLRIVSLQVEPGPRFTASLVKNTGPYAAKWWWYYGKSPEQLKGLLKKHKAIPLELETYLHKGKRRYAMVMVKRPKSRTEGGSWGLGQSAKQIKSRALKESLLEVESYKSGKQTLYAYVARPKSSAKTTTRLSQKAEQIQIYLKKNAPAQVRAMEPEGKGVWSVVFSPAEGYNRWSEGVDAEQLQADIDMYGVRLVDIEATGSGAERRFSYSAVSDTDPETARLRDLYVKSYGDDSQFFGKARRSFLVREIGGDKVAGLAEDMPLQPLSMLKILPYAYALDELDRSPVFPTVSQGLKGSYTTWYQSGPGDVDTTCLASGTMGRATWESALPTMMWESHNRTLDTFLDRFGTANLTARAQADPSAPDPGFGMPHTVMHPGCGSAPDIWWNNRTTLFDIYNLFAGVETGKLLYRKADAKSAFRSNMINLDYDGNSYNSSITGRRTPSSGSWSVGFLQSIVEREAKAIGRQASVGQFMAGVSLFGKGGSGGPSDSEWGFSDAVQVDLPVYGGGHRHFVSAFMLFGMSDSASCPGGSSDAACMSSRNKEQAALDKFRWETMAAPIRDVLKSYPAG